MRITRDSVAKKAGVSSATVSRVYNEPESVSPQLREQVFHAANELGYQPNSAAAMLRRNGNGTIAFVQFKKNDRPYYWGALDSFDWFYARALRGVQQVLEETSWQLRFYTASSRVDILKIASRCDGILAYDVDSYEEEKWLSNLEIPTVLAHHLANEATENCVRTDNVLGGELQARYLLDQGCSDPLYITGYLDSVVPHAQRLEGFSKHYKNTKIITTEIGNPRILDEIALQTQTLLNAHTIDSIAAVNDLTLFPLLMRIKQSLPAIGYDASPLFHIYPDPVASIDIRSYELYRQAALKLLRLLKRQYTTCTTVLPQVVLPASKH